MPCAGGLHSWRFLFKQQLGKILTLLILLGLERHDKWEKLDQLKEKVREFTYLGRAAAVLGWDQPTYLRPAGRRPRQPLADWAA
jgi:hypothetical protein